MNEQLTENQINAAGHLTIGGCDAVELAHKYGTPLVVYDVSKIRDQIRRFEKVFAANHVDYAVSYASKAFAAIAMYQVAAAEGAHTDVVSGGELYTAIKAGFPMDRVSFHGNNKSREELEMAIRHHVGVIILDNFHEIDLLADLLEENDAQIKVMLRITPGISAHTNKYIQTGQVDSKFGFDLQSGQADEALEKVLANPRMEMLGLHAHIGSQIFELAGFEGVADKLVEVAAHWQTKYGYQAQVIPAMLAAFTLVYLEKFFRKICPAVISMIVVPFCSLVLSVMAAHFVLGPIGWAIGSAVSSAVYAGISGPFRVIFGAVFGFVYAPLVITGLHHMSNAIDLQLVADFGGTMLWPMIALSNIAQGSAVLGMIYLQRKNAAAQEVNVPSCISCYLGVTEPAMFGVNLKYNFPFLCGMIGSAVAGVVCTATSTTANSVGVGGLPGILSIQPAYMLTFAICMVIAIVIPFVLTVAVGKKKGVN